MHTHTYIYIQIIFEHQVVVAFEYIQTQVLDTQRQCSYSYCIDFPY